MTTTNPRTKARILSLLKERPYRGLKLRQELLKRYGMSDTTRFRCLGELREMDYVERVSVGSGRSCEYRLTPAGEKWYKDYIDSQGPDLLEWVTESFPIAIGVGTIELGLTSNNSYWTKVSEGYQLLRWVSPLNKLISYMTYRNCRTQPAKQVSFTLRIKVDTLISREVSFFWDLIRKARKKRIEWHKERKKLLLKFYNDGNLTDKDRLRMCLVDYFSLCPIAALEYCLITSSGEIPNARFELDLNKRLSGYSSDLYSFALAKWPELPRDMRARIFSIWCEFAESSYDGKHFRPEMHGLYVSPEQVDKDEPRKQTFYDPNFKLMIGKGDVIDPDYPEHRSEEDFSNHTSVKHFKEAIESPKVEMWFRHLYRSTGEWAFKPELVRKHHVIGVLVTREYLDEEPILWVHKVVDEELAGKITGYYIDDARLRLHEAVRYNDILGIWNAFFNPHSSEACKGLPIPLSDDLWFKIWGWMRPELLEAPPKIIGPYREVYLREIKELPPFFQLLDRLYVSWINAKKPRLRSGNIGAIIKRAIKIFQLNARKKLDPWSRTKVEFRNFLSETKEEFQKRSEIMNIVTRKIDEYINELDWEFMI